MTSSFPPNATVVLVHAAWADGSSWIRIIPSLRDQGLGVIAAQIPLTSLSDDVAALRRVLERTQGPVVLVGHSYAGAVISAASGESRVRSLVYIAGMAPDEGETVGQLFYREPPHAMAPHIAPDEHGVIWMSEEGFRNAVAPDASVEEAMLMAATQRPISMQCLGEALPPVAWKSTPSWYLLAEQDRMISPKTQRYMAQRIGAVIHAHPIDHTPLITAPKLVVDIILQAAHATLP